MKKDVRKKIRPDFRISRKSIREHLLAVLRLADELDVVYQTYPKLRRVVGSQAWQELSDVPYRQLLELNLEPIRHDLRDGFAANVLGLEDILASALIRDNTGLRDTLSKVLVYRLRNGLATRRTA